MHARTEWKTARAGVGVAPENAQRKGGVSPASRRSRSDLMLNPRRRGPIRWNTHVVRRTAHWALAAGCLLATEATSGGVKTAGPSFELQIDLGAAEQNGLYVVLFAWALIFVGVLVAMLGSIIRNRAGRIEVPVLRGNTAAEIVWTVVPLITVVLIAFLMLQSAHA